MAFQYRVRGHRGTMHEAANLAILQDAHSLQAADGIQHRLSRIIAGGGQLQDLRWLTRAAADHVGESAADVDTDFNQHVGLENRRGR